MKGCMAERHTYISSSMHRVHALEVPYIASKPFPFLQPDAAPTSFSMRASIIPWWLEEHAFVWSDSSTGLVDLSSQGGEAGESVERGKRKGFGPLWGSVVVVAEMWVI
jgi:hypothetical protein